MKRRVKKIIDSTDREILRLLYGKYPKAASGASIAKVVNLSGSAIAPRLDNLKRQGIIKQKEIQGLRKFNRIFAGKSKPVQIKAPRAIKWGLDLKPKKKTRK